MNVLAIIERAADGPMSLRRRTNAMSVVSALERWGHRAGLDQPHRLAHYLAQLGHESLSYQHDREIWGPTREQRRYEGRRDLGNTEPGDGRRFSGRGPIQLTGRANYRRLSQWARGIAPNAPDFEQDPDRLNTDPWEGLAPIWYWSEGNPARASLNRLADQNDIEMITRRINGGLNGFGDRQRRYGRVALALAGYGPDDVQQFQRDAGLTVDGIAGPKTRGALHRRLAGLSSVVSDDVRDSPVVQPVLTPEVPLEAARDARRAGWLVTLFGAGGFGSVLMGLDWQALAVLGAMTAMGLAIVVIGGPQLARRLRQTHDAVTGQGGAAR